MNPSFVPSSDYSSPSLGPDSTFSIPLDHFWTSELSSELYRTNTLPLGLNQFVGDQPNLVLRCLQSLENIDQLKQFAWPLVLFGPSGTGKTALAMALLAKLASKNVDHRPTFLSAVDFDRRYRSSLQTNSVADFRQQFLRTSGIVIDDVHQLGPNKLTVQNQLSNLADQCIENGVPLILTMNQFPGACVNLDTRLASRLVNGLCLPVLPPGKHARVVIVKGLADLFQVDLTDDSIHWIANSFPVSVPHLNHFFTHLRIAIDSQQTVTEKQQPIDLKTLQKLTQPSPDQIEYMAQKITLSVATAFRVPVSDMKSNRRNQSIVLARNIAIFLQRELLQLSFSRIGSNFGNRDHATIMHGCQKIRSLEQDDQEESSNIRQLLYRLNRELSEHLLNIKTVSSQSVDAS